MGFTTVICLADREPSVPNLTLCQETWAVLL